MKRLIATSILILFSAGCKQQIDRLTGNDTGYTREETCAKYVWLCPEKDPQSPLYQYGPEWCQKHPSLTMCGGNQ